MVLRDLSSLVVRANDCYRFLPFDRLEAGDRQSIGDLASDPSFSGVLQQRSAGGLSLKAVSAESARLFAQCRTPRRASALLSHLSPGERDAILADLILEGVLGVVEGDRFRHSAGAYSLVVATDPVAPPATRLDELSLAALRHAEGLTSLSPIELAAKLYFYNRVPVTPKWRALWSDPTAILRHLGVWEGDPLHRALDRNYHCPPPRMLKPGWLIWMSRDRTHSSGRDTVVFKLYVSPHPRQFAAAFVEVVSRLESARCGSFKIGVDAYNLLRPDKFVLYFDDQDDLMEFSGRLASQLTGIRPQGVPFSCQLDESGCLSWGVDPPHQKTPPWLVDTSWRSWICNRLAVALKASVVTGGETVSPTTFAMAKLWLAGVDPRNWTPRHAPGTSAPVSASWT